MNHAHYRWSADEGIPDYGSVPRTSWDEAIPCRGAHMGAPSSAGQSLRRPSLQAETLSSL
ncbi:MAG: hypothetical protein WC156_00460 [Pedobacter sp.]